MVPRFFCPIPLAPHSRVALPADAAHHARRVLRLAPGDAVTLFDGTGGEYPGRIAECAPEVRVALGARCDVERESPFALTLAQALPSGDKMDWVVQKAVELGVARIQPLESARSVVRLAGARAARRVDHWRQVAVSACEQCGRNRIPEVAPLLDLRAWLARLGGGGGEGGAGEGRLLLDPQAVAALRVAARPGPQLVLVGPEGGFADDELASVRAARFTGVTLGPRVLRTETAGLAVLAALGVLHGDL